jgi:FMN hydrolase / 5-amino-6-(5-phospho-D-ribitylamino)uracil phosphatase
MPSPPRPTAFRRIRLITMDLDDTLWPCAPTIRHAEQTLYQWLHERYPRITERHTMETMRERRMELTRRQPHLRHDLSALRVESLAHHAREAGYNEDLAHAALKVFLEARHAVRPYDDVAPVLRRLRQDHLLAALTNGNADVFRLELGELFHFAVSAADVGAGKPDPAMFRTACARAQVAVDEVLHVGDSPEHDIAGARAAGIRCVWLNRSGNSWPDGHEPPDTEIADLWALPALLNR